MRELHLDWSRLGQHQVATPIQQGAVDPGLLSGCTSIATSLHPTDFTSQLVEAEI